MIQAFGVLNFGRPPNEVTLFHRTLPLFETIVPVMKSELGQSLLRAGYRCTQAGFQSSWRD